jgi:hypothetical protein
MGGPAPECRRRLFQQSPPGRRHGEPRPRVTGVPGRPGARPAGRPRACRRNSETRDSSNASSGSSTLAENPAQWPRRQALNQKDARQHNRAICTPPPCGAVVFLAAAWANFTTKDITT